MATDWKLSGSYFETCNCEAACPCVFLSPPTTGDCTVLVGWHIDRGAHEGRSLDGLNVVLAVHSPGHMAEVKWKAALYLDQRASDEQRESLTTIFGGQAGGHPAVLASHIGEILGVSTVPIEFYSQGKRRSLSIPDIAEAEIQAIDGRGGDATVENHILAIAPGHPAVVARSTSMSYDDHGLSWSMSNKTGFYSPFTYQGA